MTRVELAAVVQAVLEQPKSPSRFAERVDTIMRAADLYAANRPCPHCSAVTAQQQEQRAAAGLAAETLRARGSAGGLL